MDAPSHPDPGDKGRPRSRRRLLIALPAALLVFLLVAPYGFTIYPEACGACHQIGPYVESWRASSHSRAARNCIVCHAAPGFVNGFMFRMGLFRDLYATAIGAEVTPDPGSPLGVASCSKRGCHSLNRIASTSGDLKIGHRIHVEEAGLPCARCHPGAAHAGVAALRLTPPMKMCKQCHEGEMKDDCLYCHLEAPGAPSSDATATVH